MFIIFPSSQFQFLFINCTESLKDNSFIFITVIYIFIFFIILTVDIFNAPSSF